MNEMDNLRFMTFIRGMLGFGGMTKQYFEWFMQLMISWLVKGIHMDSCVSTRKTNTLVRGRFTSYMIVRGLGDFSF